MRANRAALFLIPFMLMLATSVYETGCAKSATTSHPGAVNAFDSNAYDALNSAQAAIEQAKTQLGSTPAAKGALNKVIASYNATMDAYVAYHKAAVAGGVPDQASLQAELTALITDVAALKTQFGGAK